MFFLLVWQHLELLVKISLAEGFWIRFVSLCASIALTTCQWFSCSCFVFEMPCSFLSTFSFPMCLFIFFLLKLDFWKLREALIFSSFLIIDSRKWEKREPNHELPSIYRTVMRSKQTLIFIKWWMKKRNMNFRPIQNRISVVWAQMNLHSIRWWNYILWD